ncbi:hypothetical protein [Streptomyces sp. NPDC024089]
MSQLRHLSGAGHLTHTDRGPHPGAFTVEAWAEGANAGTVFREFIG